MTLHSPVTGDAIVTATTATDATDKTKTVTFTADATTGAIGDLTSDKDTAIANNTDKVVFTATLKDASGQLNTWFINNGSSLSTAIGADAFCATQLGYATPSRGQMTNGPIPDGSGTRSATGPLWSEWGSMSVFANGWTISDTGAITSRYVACSRGL